MQSIRADETVRSMSIAQALRTEQAHSTAAFTLGGQEIGSVSIVANVFGISEKDSYTKYALTDGTGTITAKHWLPLEESQIFRKKILKMDGRQSTFHTIVRVTGSLALWRKTGSIVSTRSSPLSINLDGMSLSSPWEQYNHCLRVVMETLMHQRGPPPQMLLTPGPEVKQQVPAVASPDDDEDMIQSTSNLDYTRELESRKAATRSKAAPSINDATRSSPRQPSASKHEARAKPSVARAPDSVNVVDLTEDDSDVFLTADEDEDGLNNVTANLADASLKTPQKDRRVKMPDTTSPRDASTSTKRRTIDQPTRPSRSENNTPTSSRPYAPRAPVTPASASKRPRKRDPYSDLSQLERDILLLMSTPDMDGHSPTSHRSLYAFNDASTPTRSYEGVHKATVIRSIRAKDGSITDAQILRSISVLLEKAHIYATIDDDHYAIT